MLPTSSINHVVPHKHPYRVHQLRSSHFTVRGYVVSSEHSEENSHATIILRTDAITLESIAFIRSRFRLLAKIAIAHLVVK
jgi:hypothetical protein